MRSKHWLYIALALSVCFSGTMLYLYLASRNQDTGGFSKAGVVIGDRARTVSGKGGKLVVAYAGDIMGNLDISATLPLGGLARRANALASYERGKLTWPVLVLETGNEMKQSENLDDPANRWIVPALNLLGVDFLNVTPADLRRLIRLQEANQLPKETHMVFLSSVLEPSPALGLPLKPFALQTLKAAEGDAEVHAGVLAVSPSSKETTQGVSLLTPDQALKRYLPEVDAKSDIVVLLARMTAYQLSRLAGMFPGIDLIVNGTSNGEGKEYAKVGNTVIVEASMEGMTLGAIDLEWDAKGHITKYQNQLIPLVSLIPEEPKLARLTREAKEVQAGIAEAAARKVPRPAIPSVLAGSKPCKVCHEKAYEVWEKSRHAHAIETLKESFDQFNSKCLPCHVTGFSVKNGFINVITTPELANVGCEDCHGKGAGHVNNPQTIKTGLGLTVQAKTCLRCHSPVRSPGFDFNSAWLKIKH